VSSRDGWCTPQWLAQLIGPVDLDPCSNDRGHVQARVKYTGAPFCGLENARHWSRTARVFVNPPYSRGQVVKWVRAYVHTDFIFLLRWDPSTVWFADLMAATEYVWFPLPCPGSRRLEFEPPPGVDKSSNPYPHALYMRSPPARNLRAAGRVFTQQWSTQ
jgi:hypothetical protein